MWTLDGIDEINAVTEGIPGTTETREVMSPWAKSEKASKWIGH